MIDIYVIIWHLKNLNLKTILRPSIVGGKVGYCVVTKANLGIMSCRHDTYPSQHYAGCCFYPDGLEFY